MWAALQFAGLIVGLTLLAFQVVGVWFNWKADRFYEEAKDAEKRRLATMKMEFYFIACFAPKGCKVRIPPEIGAVQAVNGDEALRIAAIRYPKRFGWTFELVPTIDHTEENQVLEEEHNWRYRRDLVNRLLDQNFQCVR